MHDVDPSVAPAISHRELAALYIEHAHRYYRRRHRQDEETGEAANIESVLKRWLQHAGANNIAARTTRHTLRSWLDQLAAENLSRSYVNACLARVRRMLRWAADLEYIPVAVLAELQLVRPLPAFRSAARETQPRQPALLDQVRRSLPFLPPHARDVVHLLTLTGARLAEILELESRHVHWSPARLILDQHKTAHHGRTRIIPLNSTAASIIERRCRPICPNEPLFIAPRRSKSGIYSPDALRHAIARACRRAGVTKYTPHQIRHAVARLVRETQGLSAAQALLGHSSITQTEDYAPLPHTAAFEAAEVLE